MNCNKIIIKNDIIPPLHNACINGNVDEVYEILINDENNINLGLANGDTPLSIAINYFLNSKITVEGDLTPKYWDNPFVKIIILLIQNGVNFTPELMHMCLFSERPIFTINDFFEIFTAVGNKYPLHSSIELSNMCSLNSITHDCFKKEYMNLMKLFKDFSIELLDKCRNTNEAKNLILTLKNGKNCIDLALEIEDKDFIAHKYVQTEFEEKWQGEINEYTITKKLCYTFLPFLHMDSEWYSIPCIKYYVHTVFNIIFLFLLYIQTYTLTKVVPDTTEIIIFIWVIGLIITEIHQFRSFKLGVYLADKWNYFDIFILINFIVIITLRGVIFFSYQYNDTPELLIISEHLMSLNIILSFLRILNVCQIHSVLGPLLLMLRKMMTDMIMFFCILSVFLGGFSLGLTKIYHRLGENTGLSTISETSMKLFCALFGEFEMSDFKVQGNEIIEFTGILLFMVYLILAVIILINLFIAMLSNTYSVVQEDSEKEWKYSRVSLIITYSRYSSVPAPLNIFSCFINTICNIFTNHTQVAPDTYLVELDIQNSELINNVLKRYHKKKELLRTNDISALREDIEKLVTNVKLLNTYFTDSLETNTPINKGIVNS